MKQHITYEQMCEIDNEKLSILANLRIDLFEFVKEANANQGFNIGKMIEILDKDWFIEILTGEGEADCKIKLVERKDCRDRFDNPIEETFEADELCDALWEAVKGVTK